MKSGDRVAYIPLHAAGDITHPDVESEFRPQGSDSLSAPTGHRSFLQIPPAPSGVLE